MYVDIHTHTTPITGKIGLYSWEVPLEQIKGEERKMEDQFKTQSLGFSRQKKSLKP